MVPLINIIVTVYGVPSTSIVTTGRQGCFPHFTDEDAEAWPVKAPAQGQLACQW